jgi:hypothetical protein
MAPDHADGKAVGSTLIGQPFRIQSRRSRLGTGRSL